MEPTALGAAADEDPQPLVAHDLLAVQVVAALDAEGVDLEARVFLGWFQWRERIGQGLRHDRDMVIDE